MKKDLAMVGFDNKSSENICQPLHLITSSQACNQDFWEGVGPSEGGYQSSQKRPSRPHPTNSLVWSFWGKKWTFGWLGSSVACLTIPDGLSRVGKNSTFLNFPQISISFSYFSSNFPHFCPHFGPQGGRVTHSGRSWLTPPWLGLMHCISHPLFLA